METSNENRRKMFYGYCGKQCHILVSCTEPKMDMHHTRGEDEWNVWI